MAEKYDHKLIEKKWQDVWTEAELYGTLEDKSKPKCYVLDMFPYPSGEGLHTGHARIYTASDVYARYKRLSGFSVLHPTGWDAFGLPAEQYAIKNKIHPREAVNKNVATFRRQMQALGFSYDWEREVDTTDPAFYKWTQWIFLKMFEKGLAYESYEPINWCPSCQTGLANEDLEDGRCERCGTPIEKKPMRQWVLRITDYADKMLEGLEELPLWPYAVKEAQRNWIGRSQGAEIDFKIKDSDHLVTVFTTRPDTLFGATYVVLAPETKLLDELREKILNWDEVSLYCDEVKQRTEIERTTEGREKTGVRLEGVTTINPANGEELPIFIADYVLGHYGTGAVMAVPAHDERDFEFAKKYELPIVMVVCPHFPNPSCPILDNAYTGEGKLVMSGAFDGMSNEDAKKKITDFVKGRFVTKYRLKDWVFSRQRYWGEPIPLIHCEKCGIVPVPEKDLPVLLPEVESYTPTGSGESPLADIPEWVNMVCPKCGGKGKRETNTMPQWAGSSWYYLRYIDPKNSDQIFSQEKERVWMPVDVYVGGMEHATRHLIYARFWHKFLYDLGIVSTKEPFVRLESVGLVLGEGGIKMSKRLGNVVNPDTVIESYGADTLRLYEMFMGPFSQAGAWSTESIVGPRRFLERVWRLQEKVDEHDKNKIESLLHRTIKKVGDDIESFSFNTAISTLMILVNEMEKLSVVPRVSYETLLVLLAPFAPHITEELWGQLGNEKSIHLAGWPTYDDTKCSEREATIVIQVNGKVRDTIIVPTDTDEVLLREMVLVRPAVIKWVNGKEIKKVIVVKDRLVNIVVTN